MRFYYDLHIHSALSPCADDDMTPSNIIAMAKLCGLDIIAVTDHNSVQNAAAVMEASKRENGPLVIAGMELTTSEDIHAVLLFKDIESAVICEKEVRENQPKIKNRKDIFGAQLVLDSNDNAVKEEEFLLINATGISIENLPDLAARYNAVSFPAHIDKPSNGIIAILGTITPQMGFSAVEVNPSCPKERMEELANLGYKVIINSDSHFLGVMNEKNSNFLELETLNTEQVLKALNKNLQTQ